MTLHDKSALSIVLLERQNLDLAIRLALSLFPGPEDRPDESLSAIFAPHLYSLDFRRGICDRICWTWQEPYRVTEDRTRYDVLGIIGLYRRLNEPNALHLGWFGVDPAARGRGIGGHLLDFAIAEARRAGVPYLRLDTTDEPDLAAANRLYDQRGFVTTKTRSPSPGQAWSTIWRELHLSPLVA